MSKINKIRLSGTDYDIQDVSATSVVEVTQQQYDDLPASAKTDNILYIITDSTVDYVTSAQTQSAITQEVSGKVDTSTYTAYTAATDTAIAGKQDTLVSGTNIKTINNESLLGSGNIDIQGGGSSYSAGTGIDITNDVISVTGKVSTSDFNTYSGSVDSRLSEDEEVTAAGLNALNDKIDSISGANAIEVTQAEYDALVTGGTVDPDTFYIITDATPADMSQYWTSAQTQSAITQAVSGKQDTLVSGTNIKTINNESILGSGNIDIQGGGGKAVSGGTNISITTGETADTINCTLPISADTGGIYTTSSYPFTSTAPRSYNAVFGNSNVIDVFGSTRSSNFNALFGNNNGVRADGGSSSSHFIAGSYNNVRGTNNYQNALFGYHNNSQNNSEFGCGQYNNSVAASTTFGDSGNTLFSVGNGTSTSARHNAFEIRQNGDIYLTKDGQDVKLQDQLGGSSITVDTVLDSGSTNPVENRVIYNKIDEVEQVTAAGLNTLNDKFGGLKLVKLSQAAYDSLATKDQSTLYVIVD